MTKISPVFTAQPEQTPSCRSCNFHIRGCCFDPKKKVDGFVATPCFGCKDIE